MIIISYFLFYRYGVVYRGKYKKTDVAIKQWKESEILSENKQAFDTFQKEIHVMKSLKPHPNVVALVSPHTIANVLQFGVCLSAKPFSIVTEYYPNGSLDTFMRKFELRDEDYKKIYLGISKGLYHLHTEGRYTKC